MAQIRLNKLIRQYNISLNTLTSYLKTIGYDVAPNPNSKVDEACIEQVSKRFAKDLEAKKLNERVEIRVSEILSKSKSSGSSEFPELTHKPDFEDIVFRQKNKIGPEQAKVKANAPIYASAKAPNGTIQQPKVEHARKSSDALVHDGMNWDIFDAIPVSDKNSPVDTDKIQPDWEISLEKAIKSIPTPIDDQTKSRILSLVAQWLDNSIDNSIPAAEKHTKEILPDDIISHVKIGDKGYLESIFAYVEGREIPKKRELVRNILAQDSLSGTDFWYFVNRLLTIDANIYRRPICEAVYRYQNIKNITLKTDAEINQTSVLLFRDTEKCHQAIQFFYPFRKNLPPVVRQDIMDATRYLSSIEDLEFAFNILGSDIQEKLYLLKVNESIASQYLGFSSLLDYKNQNGVEAVEKIDYLNTYMNCLSGDSISWRLINKLVLGDNSEMTDAEAVALTKDGFDSFCKHIQKVQTKIIKREQNDNIKKSVGKQVHFQYAGESKWNIFGSTNIGCGFILPKSWVDQPIVKGEWYYATAVMAIIRKPTLLVLSQKTIKAGDLRQATTVKVGEIVEARFSLFNDQIEANILSHGPTKATIRNIPKKFDYKLKHKVKILRVFDVNSCEIEIVG